MNSNPKPIRLTITHLPEVPRLRRVENRPHLIEILRDQERNEVRSEKHQKRHRFQEVVMRAYFGGLERATEGGEDEVEKLFA